MALKSRSVCKWNVLHFKTQNRDPKKIVEGVVAKLSNKWFLVNVGFFENSIWCVWLVQNFYFAKATYLCKLQYHLTI